MRYLIMAALLYTAASCTKPEICDVTVTSITGNGAAGLYSITYSDGTSEFDTGDKLIQIGDCKL